MSKFKPSRESFLNPARNEARTSRPGIGSALAEPPQTAETSVVFSGTRTDAADLTGPPKATLSLGFACTLAFIFLRFSFIHEFLSYALHFDTHLLVLLGLVAYGAWLVSGDLFVAFSERLAWIWMAFVAWVVVATATSTWRGGSFAVVFPYIRTTLPLLLLIPAVTFTRLDVKRIINTIGAAGVATTLFGLIHRSYSAGRLEISSEGSSIQDPNDYAAHLIFMLPAMAYLLFAKQRSIGVKIFGAAIVGAALFEVLSTGSRGGLVCLLATAAYGLVKSPPKVRVSLLIGAPLLAALAIPLAPESATQRLASLFNSKDESESAAASTGARRALLMESLKATASHPIVGVGPGVFMDYQAGVAASEGHKGFWHETHNGYTQLSSEAGIPALLLYLAAVIRTFTLLRRAIRSPFPDLADIGRTMSVMVVAFSTSLVFLAQGYRFTMLVVGAITIALTRVLDSELARLPASARSSDLSVTSAP